MNVIPQWSQPNVQTLEARATQMQGVGIQAALHRSAIVTHVSHPHPGGSGVKTLSPLSCPFMDTAVLHGFPDV